MGRGGRIRSTAAFAVRNVGRAISRRSFFCVTNATKGTICFALGQSSFPSPKALGFVTLAPIATTS